MYRGKTIGVVVPAYNEEEFVGEVIDTVPAFVDRVYVVDDCSTDGTWMTIQQHADRQNRPVTADESRPQSAEPELAIQDGGARFERRVVPIRHEVNRGVGGAITTGYSRALEDGIDVTAVMNGDGQMDPDILDRIVDPVVRGEADYAKGNRLGRHHEMPPQRLVGNVLLTVLTKFASGYWGLLDSQNGYSAISRQALEQLELDQLYESFGFLNDLLIRLNVNGMRIVDVPMRAMYGDESSDIEYSSFIPGLSMLLLSGFLWRLKVTYLADGFPDLLYPLGMLGIATGTAGLLLTVALEGAGGILSGVGWLLLFAASALAIGIALTVELGRSRRMVGEELP